MEAFRRALADSGFRHGAVAGFALGATVFCGTFSILLHVGVFTS